MGPSCRMYMFSNHTLLPTLVPCALQVETELKAAGLSDAAISAILATMQARSLQELEQLLGSSNAGVAQLQHLFQLAEGYGYLDWLSFDASIVRGLAYYTGPQACCRPAVLLLIFIMASMIEWSCLGQGRSWALALQVMGSVIIRCLHLGHGCS